MTHLYVWHDSYTWSNRVCDMSCSFAWRIVLSYPFISCGHVGDFFLFIYVWLNVCMHIACLIYIVYVTWLMYKGVTWRIHLRDMTYSYHRFTCVTWLIHICMTRRIHSCGVTHSYHTFMRVTCSFIYVTMPHSHIWHGTFICVTRLSYLREMSHLHVWHDSFMRTPYLEICTISRDMVWHDSVTCVKWVIYMCDMTRSCDRHISRYGAQQRANLLTPTNASCHAYRMSPVTHMNESCRTCEWVMSRI